PAAQQLFERFLDQSLRAGVDGGRGFIEDENAWLRQRRPRDGQQLPLAEAETATSLAEDGVVAVWQTLDEGVGARELSGCFDFFIRRGRTTVADVVHDGIAARER